MPAFRLVQNWIDEFRFASICSLRIRQNTALLFPMKKRAVTVNKFTISLEPGSHTPEHEHSTERKAENGCAWLQETSCTEALTVFSLSWPSPERLCGDYVGQLTTMWGLCGEHIVKKSFQLKVQSEAVFVCNCISSAGFFLYLIEIDLANIYLVNQMIYFW